MSTDTPSNWKDATEVRLDLETLQLLILLIREAYEQSGCWMTAMELQAALQHPGR